MAFKKEKAVPRADATPVTPGQQRDLLEEQLIAAPQKVIDKMSDAEIVEIAKRYRPSTPIKIPNHLLSPDYEYRWVNKTQKNWRRRRGTGWTPITDKGENRLERFLKPGVSIDEMSMGTHYDPDGYLCLDKDLVLCFIVKRIAEVIRKSLSDEQRARLRASRSVFHEAGKLAGVSTYDKD